MKIINHGKWEPYVSTLEIHQAMNVITYQNADGIDLWEYWKEAFQDNSIVVSVNAEGDIVESCNKTFPIVPFGDVSLVEIVLEEGDEPDYIKYVGKRIDLFTAEFLDKPIQVPHAVPAAQAKIALYNISPGLLESFSNYVKRSKNVPLKIYFTESTHWVRDSEYLSQLTKALGWDELTVDNIFIEGVKLINT